MVILCSLGRCSSALSVALVLFILQIQLGSVLFVQRRTLIECESFPVLRARSQRIVFARCEVLVVHRSA
jgi:lipopolysaccharide/colanic/teichoic acid biosynthesis glycosyltransferase